MSRDYVIQNSKNPESTYRFLEKMDKVATEAERLGLTFVCTESGLYIGIDRDVMTNDKAGARSFDSNKLAHITLNGDGGAW